MIHKKKVHQPISSPGIGGQYALVNVYITPRTSKFSCVRVWVAHQEAGTKFSIHTNIFADFSLLQVAANIISNIICLIFVLLIYASINIYVGDYARLGSNVAGLRPFVPSNMGLFSCSRNVGT